MSSSIWAILAACWFLDETGFVKKGSKSAGVQRQYCGTAGRIENCQIGVFLAYASRYGRALIDRALYLPESLERGPGSPSRGRHPRARSRFADQAEARPGDARAGPRRRRALRPSAACGSRSCRDGSAAGRWVTADSVYGADHVLRRWLQEHRLGYVLAVTKAQRLGFGRVEDRVGEVPPQGWHRLSAGDGAKGPRLYDWAYLALRRATPPPGWERGLLIRRSITEPDKLAFYLTHAADGTALVDLVQVAGTRWAIEACFEAAKGEVGLDQYEVRSWTGWHRHVTLAMLAHAYLAALRKVAVGGRASLDLAAELLPLTVPGGAPAALAARLASSARHRGHPRLVALAPPPPATRTTLSLAAPCPH